MTVLVVWFFFSLHGSYLWGKGERKLMHGRAHWVWDRNACNDQGHSQGVKHQITASGIYHLPFFSRVGFEPVTHLLDCKQHISYFSFVSQWIENTLHNFTFLLVVDCGEKKDNLLATTQQNHALCTVQQCVVPENIHTPPPWKTLWFAPLPTPPVFSFPGGLWWPPPPFPQELSTNLGMFFFSVPLTALILSRDALLIGYAFYLRFKSLPSPVSMICTS